jgi:release factor glutamine methyltransferase
MLTLKAALEAATASIGRVDAHVLVAHLLGVDRSYLIANPMRVLTESEDARIDSLVAQRAIGHPVAYLVAQREFYGRPFEISVDVLIPRPETETLVEAALARAPHGASVADLGTGSGAIAVTLARERQDLRVCATDASAAALAVAKRNARTLSAMVEFVEGSWYAPLANRRFGLIVSNPPYIAKGDRHLAQGDLRFEPAAALCDGSRDGLDSIRAIVAGAAAHLEPGGWLLIEHGYDQKDAVGELLRLAGFAERISIEDLAGIPRVAGGKMQG